VGTHVDALGLILVGLALARGTREGLTAPDDLHTDKPGSLDLGDVLSLQESAANSGSPDGDVLAARLRNVLVDDDVGDLQPATRLQDPERLLKDRVLVRGEVDHAV
jgi:hypothetical protein